MSAPITVEQSARYYAAKGRTAGEDDAPLTLEQARALYRQEREAAAEYDRKQRATR